MIKKKFNTTAVTVAQSKEEVKKILPKSSSLVVSKTIPSYKHRQKMLENKWRREQIQKLADKIKGDPRLDHIKSVGDGL
jgi:uncharacterized circularly permuted ATP-grasp superfamily protein